MYLNTNLFANKKKSSDTKNVLDRNLIIKRNVLLSYLITRYKMNLAQETDE